jgi:phosphocarrier protein
MAIMALAVKHGDTVTVSAEGADEDTAITALEDFFKANL